MFQFCLQLLDFILLLPASGLCVASVLQCPPFLLHLGLICWCQAWVIIIVITANLTGCVTRGFECLVDFFDGFVNQLPISDSNWIIWQKLVEVEMTVGRVGLFI